MIRNISLKKIDSNAQSQEIDDSLTCVVELYFVAETLLELKDQALNDVSADKVFAFNATSNNNHRLMKQVRAYQRNKAIYFSQRKDLTHYVFDKRKLKVERFNETSVCNRIRIVHLYAIEEHADFSAIKKIVTELS